MSPGSLPGAVDSKERFRQEGAKGLSTIAVCHLVSGDRWAGAEVQVATLLKYLKRESNLSLSAVVLNSGHLAQAIQSAGVETQVIAESENGFLAIARHAARYLEAKAIQILHSHRYKENLLAALLARRLGIPHVVRTQHGLPEPQAGIRRLKQSLILGVDRLVARRATDRVISVSPEMSRRLALEFDPRKLVTIPNGVDLEVVGSRFTVQEAKERLGIPPESPVIGTAGRLEAVKRLDIFLRAATAIRGERATTRFVIAGEGREMASLKSLAGRLGITEAVRFLGHRDDIYDVVRAFDLLVLSSDHEGLPMILLEAQCLGVAVVARAVGGIPDVIRDGVNGLLVDSSDPRDLARVCCAALSDEGRRQRLAESGTRLVAENYSASATARQVAQLYSSLVTRS
ncbi:MAG: glycosyltransferase [Terriglobia bacterium]